MEWISMRDTGISDLFSSQPRVFLRLPGYDLHFIKMHDSGSEFIACADSEILIAFDWMQLEHFRFWPHCLPLNLISYCQALSSSVSREIFQLHFHARHSHPRLISLHPASLPSSIFCHSLARPQLITASFFLLRSPFASAFVAVRAALVYFLIFFFPLFI
jgi:hypothetical protein